MGIEEAHVSILQSSLDMGTVSGYRIAGMVYAKLKMRGINGATAIQLSVMWRMEETIVQEKFGLIKEVHINLVAIFVYPVDLYFCAHPSI